MYLRNAVILNLHQPHGSCGMADLEQFSQRLNLADGVEHSPNRTPHKATEMNFGLHSAGSGRLARHGG